MDQKQVRKHLKNLLNQTGKPLLFQQLIITKTMPEKISTICESYPHGFLIRC